MPYKRLSRIVWTFSIPGFVLIFRDVEFFNSHAIYHSSRKQLLTTSAFSVTDPWNACSVDK
jgi:hypothetical protein